MRSLTKLEINSGHIVINGRHARLINRGTRNLVRNCSGQELLIHRLDVHTFINISVNGSSVSHVKARRPKRCSNSLIHVKCLPFSDVFIEEKAEESIPAGYAWLEVNLPNYSELLCFSRILLIIKVFPAMHCQCPFPPTTGNFNAEAVLQTISPLLLNLHFVCQMRSLESLKN